MNGIGSYQRWFNRAAVLLLVAVVLFGTMPLFVVSAVVIALVLVARVAVSQQHTVKVRVGLSLVYLLLMISQIVFFVVNMRFALTWRGAVVRLVASGLLLIPLVVTVIVNRGNHDRLYLPRLNAETTISFADFKANRQKLRQAVAGVERLRHVLAIRNIKAILSDMRRHSMSRYINEGTLGSEYFRQAEATLADPSLYIVISNTGSPASELISLFTQKQFNHASLSFDADLTTIISYNGGEQVYPPGLNAEMIEAFHKKADAAVLVYRLPVTRAQKARVLNTVAEINQTGSAYNILGLVTKHSLRRNIMFCSQFVYSMLQVADAAYFQKQPGDVTPTDFIELDYRRKLEFVTEIRF